MCILGVNVKYDFIKQGIDFMLVHCRGDQDLSHVYHFGGHFFFNK